MFRVVFLAFFAAPAPAGLAHGGGHGGGQGPAYSTPPRVAHAALHNETVAEGAHVNQPPHAHEPPATMLLPLWVLALLTMAVGVYFTINHGQGEAAGPAWLTPSAVGVAVAGILLAWLTYQRRSIDAASLAGMFAPIRTAALAKFWIDDLFEAAYGVLLLGFAGLVGWFDRYVVDGLLNAVSAWTLSAGDGMRQIQTGRAQDYVYGVAVGVLVLVLLMRLVFV
jgi:NADH:ubiquinone oxidoreductase subunit 5 (subunit L)/multisubunit Na+/H+ antiporter MnhA subunit